MTKLLVYRFSAMGDVILLLPVLRGVLDSNSDVEIYLLTQKSFFPVFKNIDRLYPIEVDLKGKHSGIKGLYRLFKTINKEVKPDVVLDLHSVIRTLFLDLVFLLFGYHVVNFRKGTFRKKSMIRSKSIQPVLPSTIDRYSDAFVKSGFQVNLSDPPLLKKIVLPIKFRSVFNKSLVIGIAPFAKHQQKIWGVSKVEELILEINRMYDANILLFGGGKTEFEILNQISKKFSNCIVSANHFSLSEEIEILPMLAVMVSMDSANMHLASMAGIPTISIWGATHPSLGFAPYKQPPENLIQYNGDQLPCRPCSVYGNKKCIYTDGIRCMEYVTVNMVLNRINQILSANSV
jgi:ADP-heptose:LPS heptosyltransferase